MSNEFPTKTQSLIGRKRSQNFESRRVSANQWTVSSGRWQDAALPTIEAFPCHIAMELWRLEIEASESLDRLLQGSDAVLQCHLRGADASSAATPLKLTWTFQEFNCSSSKPA